VAGKVLKVGIAGQGRSGFDIHARWLREATDQYKIVAVADLLPERRGQAKTEFGCRVYEDYKELIGDKDLDLFLNCLPSPLHPKGTIEALRAGHNVVCEKPLATKVADVDKMVAAARKARKLLAPFQNSRFYPFFRKTRELIASGKLGTILHVRLAWSGFSRRWDWQTRQDLWGGSLNNTGPHPMDHAVMLFGPKTPKVFAVMRSGENAAGDADDFTLVTLYGKGSPTVEVVLSSYMAYPQGDRLFVGGTRGCLAGGAKELKWKYFDPAKAPAFKLMKGWSDNRQYCWEPLPWVEEQWSCDVKDEFAYNSEAFYDNIHDVMTGNGKLVVTPQQVRRQIAVIEECHRQNRLPKRKK